MLRCFCHPKDRSTLTKRQLHALPFLISNPSIELAAKQAGVYVKQIFDGLNLPFFAASQ